jgi:hypothetical protein
MLPIELMHDTLFHSNINGAFVRTVLLAASICRELDICKEGWRARLQQEVARNTPADLAPDWKARLQQAALSN